LLFLACRSLLIFILFRTLYAYRMKQNQKIISQYFIKRHLKLVKIGVASSFTIGDLKRQFKAKDKRYNEIYSTK
jgi:hypothetical protein